jgi:hypothetical protein
MRNTRRNHLITLKGVTKTLSEWCQQYGLEHSLVRQRLVKQKLTPGQALGVEC